jgi:hypothetical protein
MYQESNLLHEGWIVFVSKEVLCVLTKQQNAHFIVSQVINVHHEQYIMSHLNLPVNKVLSQQCII